MDSTHWAQGIGLLKKPLMEEGGDLVHSSFLSNNNNSSTSSIRATLIIPHEEVVERRAIRSTSSLEKKEEKEKEKEKVHKYCPRCNSTNTKFCYYNNYSLTQPRYFCKTCRRYWTDGGSLRNVPVGGGSRKNKKHSSFPNLNNNPSSSSSSSSSSTKMSSNYQPFDHQVQDLNLSFLNNSNSNSNSNSGGPILGMPMPMPMPMSVVPDRDSSVMLFPFGEMKQHVGEPPMFWNYGMMGGGGGDVSW